MFVWQLFFRILPAFVIFTLTHYKKKIFRPSYPIFVQEVDPKKKNSSDRHMVIKNLLRILPEIEDYKMREKSWSGPVLVKMEDITKHFTCLSFRHARFHPCHLCRSLLDSRMCSMTGQHLPGHRCPLVSTLLNVWWLLFVILPGFRKGRDI
jgi:hypothetical protein